jgi:hypothetical protein
MFLAGGGVKGFGSGGFANTGVYGCSRSDPVPWEVGPSGSMFGASRRYLKRAIDYRSVLGKLIRDHLGATPAQLTRILPGYADAREKLQTGGESGIDGVPIMGEPQFI